jgi:hypothetical protein
MVTGNGKEIHFLRTDVRALSPTCEKLLSFTRESGARVSCSDFYQTQEGGFVAVLGCEGMWHVETTWESDVGGDARVTRE